MKILLDTHTHTLASTHAYSTVLEMAKYASEAGMEAIAITDHAPAIPDGAHPWHFQNLKAIPREIYGVKILYGAEVNILDLEGNIDLADEVLEKLDVVNASIHAPCYKDGDATDHTSAYLAIVNNPLVDVICHSGSPAFVYDYEKIIDLARKIAEICKEKEVGIVVSSDAHITFDLGNYNNALGMLSEISFPEKLVINRDLKSFEAYMKEKGKELFKWHM